MLTVGRVAPPEGPPRPSLGLLSAQDPPPRHLPFMGFFKVQTCKAGFYNVITTTTWNFCVTKYLQELNVEFVEVLPNPGAKME